MPPRCLGCGEGNWEGVVMKCYVNMAAAQVPAIYSHALYTERDVLCVLNGVPCRGEVKV
jgi:hypothetical protein